MLEPMILAPMFSLSNEMGKDVFLGDYLGTWVLLYFYPKDDTPGCTAEACGIRDAWKAFEDAGVIVFGINTDSIESHKKFKEKYHLPFSLLSDEEKVVVRAYQAGGIFVKRISYLIGLDGYIKKVYPKVQPSEHAAEILRDVKMLA